MRTLLASCVLFLVLEACAKAPKAPDVPPPTLSPTAQVAYDQHLSGLSLESLGSLEPAVFVISEDGATIRWSFCPQGADPCPNDTMVGDAIDWCDERAATSCHVYARGKQKV